MPSIDDIVCAVHADLAQGFRMRDELETALNKYNKDLNPDKRLVLVNKKAWLNPEDAKTLLKIINDYNLDTDLDLGEIVKKLKANAEDDAKSKGAIII